MCLNFLNLESNFSKKVGEWEKILAYYNDYVDDDEVWAIARESKQIPILANIYQAILLNKIQCHFCEDLGSEDVEFWTFINSIDTHLHINKMDILTFNNYKEALKRAKKNLN